MNIDDFLKRKQFRDLDEYLTSEMDRTAGDDLITQMDNIFKTREKARDWHFSPHLAFGGERAYDVCKRGQANLVIDELVRIEYGIY